MRAELAGFGVCNTRQGAPSYQDRWVAGTGAGGAWLAVADGIGGGPAGEEAAQVAVGLAQLVLGSGTPTQTDVLQVFDAVYTALRPWWLQERGGGTTLTVAAVTPTGLFVAAVGDSPAYIDFGAGFELVTEPKASHLLKEWLGSADRPRPSIDLWRWSEHDVRAVLVTSDGVDPDAVANVDSGQSAAGVVSTLREAPALGGDDASAAVAVIVTTATGVAQ